ncbi:MAG TPA: cytochrome c peroxidase [Nannocystaceae bacterium]|nr:cytochrome c peroxidase [Nannocystaceae bacterium]
MLLALACEAARAAPAPAPAGKAPHGANAPEAQLAELARLELGKGGPPPGLDAVVWQSLVPADNAPSAERIALGQKLYFDPRLSADGTVACATCHDVLRGFSDRRPLAEGIGDQLGRRNSPTTMNAMLLGSQFWDGRAPSLEAQALLPIVNPIEMGQPDGDAATKAIAGDADYERMFQAAYGRAPSYEDIGRALASFERTFVFLDAPFDRFAKGEAEAMSAAAQRGWALFNGKARCVTCHPINVANPLGTDDRFHNIGVSARHQNFDALVVKALAMLEKDPTLKGIDELALETDASELGRFLVSRSPADIGAFRSQQIRNVGITAPYMHDGSLATLWDVMDHYNKGGEANRFLDGGMEALALTEDELADMVEFLFALTDVRFAEQNEAEKSRQGEIAAKQRPFRDDDLALRRVLQFEPRTKGEAPQ